MNALNTLQISTSSIRETLKGEGKGPEGDGKAFLQALLDSEYAADGEITGEELVRFLQSRGGKDLPVLGELLPEMLAVEGQEAPIPAVDTDSGEARQPEEVVAGLLAMIEGPHRAETRVGGSSGLDAFLQQGGGDRTMTAAQLREVLIQGMAAARSAEADGAAKQTKLEDFQAALNRLTSPVPGAASQPAPEAGQTRAAPTLQINTPPGQPGWGQAVGDKMVWMVRQEVQQARIQLNPPGMGPLDISVNIQDDKASVTLTAQHAVTREALQAELPRLRSMMNEQGFDAVDVNVAEDSGGQRYEAEGTDGGGQGGRGGDGEESDAALAEAEVNTTETRLGDGLIDHYA
ncbi:flagellar hook-length control protein FliK [Ectothiorhodospiraceae bacterium WFHF3C12]|nr:flagellar hook-length control protein FliK [Ectothiorhodospiraceae bacterium WFHF3C12]